MYEKIKNNNSYIKQSLGLVDDKLSVNLFIVI